MNGSIMAAGALALLGCGIVGGVFFAFSSFVMKALVRLPAASGIAAMQSINVVVLNRSFLSVFLGTAVLCLLVAGIAVTAMGIMAGSWFVAGALLYLCGTFLVTVRGNVPLNEHLAALSPADSSATAVWAHYVDRWTVLNTIRTVAAVAAASMFTIALAQIGPT